MTSTYRLIAIPCIGFVVLACGGQVSIGDLGGVVSVDGGAVGRGGSGGNSSAGAATSTGTSTGGSDTGGSSSGAGGSSSGAGGASIDAGPDGGLGARCASGVYWTNGDTASSSMNPGRPCLGSGCHTSSSKTAFTMAGTLYAANGSHDDNDCNGENGAGIAVIPFDDMDNEIIGRIVVNSVGNFYTNKMLPPTFFVKVIRLGRERRMMAPVTNGNCNYCHTTEDFMSAKGRIVGPAP